MEKINSKTRSVALCGILAALALTLAALEGLIPSVPFMPPGAKIGLSNIVTMFAAATAGLPSALIIALIKSGFVLLTNGPTAAFMSVCGGVFSTLMMSLALRYGRFGYMGVGMIGGVCHNAAQLIAAIIITGVYRLYMYAPALVIFGVLSGAVTGFILRLVLPILKKLRLNENNPRGEKRNI